MPAHIYIRVGRYHDAVVSNLEATAADKSYITQCHVQGAPVDDRALGQVVHLRAQRHQRAPAVHA